MLTRSTIPMVREGWQGVSIGCLVSNKKQYSTEVCVLQIRYFIFYYYETTNELEMISWKCIFRILFSFGSLELHFQLWYIVTASCSFIHGSLQTCCCLMQAHAACSNHQNIYYMSIYFTHNPLSRHQQKCHTGTQHMS